MACKPRQIKTCSKCGLQDDKSLFLTDKCICKSCNNSARRARYESMVDVDRSALLDRNKKWRCDNREVYREQRRNYERKHKEKAVERGRKFREIHASEIPAKKRAYHVKNAEKVRSKVRQWRKENPNKHRALNSRRRAKQFTAEGYHYTNAQHIEWRWQMWGGKCWMCSSKAEATDHVIPLNAGGSHWPSNLRPICKSCNSRRSKKRPQIRELTKKAA